jgi:uncharacterized protein (TIGR02611 family)
MASSIPAAARANRLATLRGRVRASSAGRVAWRVGVTVVGVAVIAGGVVLLPLPGPGWLVIFAGLGILATEYAWAARLLAWVREQVRRWTRWLARQPLWLRALAGFATLLVIAGVAAAAWFITR